MTEDELRWLNGTNPLALLDARHPMHTHGSLEPQKRQPRMYLLACARRARVWNRLPGVCRTLVELAEIYADAPKRLEHLRAAVAPVAADLMQSEGAAEDFIRAEADLSFLSVCDGNPAVTTVLASLKHRVPRVPAPDSPDPVPRPDEWRGLAALVYLPFDTHTPSFRWVPRPLHDVLLIREVYGNPYRRVPFDPRWRTDTAVSIARGMYDAYQFSGMPILADALQDAGCDEPAILNHCRDPNQVHARGCWVLDLILSKDR